MLLYQNKEEHHENQDFGSKIYSNVAFCDTFFNFDHRILMNCEEMRTIYTVLFIFGPHVQP